MAKVEKQVKAQGAQEVKSTTNTVANEKPVATERKPVATVRTMNPVTLEQVNAALVGTTALDALYAHKTVNVKAWDVLTFADGKTERKEVAGGVDVALTWKDVGLDTGKASASMKKVKALDPAGVKELCGMFGVECSDAQALDGLGLFAAQVSMSTRGVDGVKSYEQGVNRDTVLVVVKKIRDKAMVLKVQAGGKTMRTVKPAKVKVRK